MLMRGVVTLIYGNNDIIICFSKSIHLVITYLRISCRRAYRSYSYIQNVRYLVRYDIDTEFEEQLHRQINENATSNLPLSACHSFTLAFKSTQDVIT